MTWVLVLEVFLIGVSLSMDALAVSVTDGLCYRNLTKRRGAVIPLTFALFQAIMPLIGFFVAYGLGQAFSTVFDKIDHWIAFVLLAVIGGKMIFDSVKIFRSNEENVTEKKFAFYEVFVQGIATSIDALFVGVTFVGTEGLKNNIPNVLLSAIIIGCTTFVISLIGLIVGIKVGDILKKKAGICQLVGGLVLIGIGIKILVQGLI